MKQLSLLVFCLIALAACRKDEKHTAQISAKAGTLDFYASGGLVTGAKEAHGTLNVAHIEGSMPNGATIKLWIKDYTGRLEVYEVDSVHGDAAYVPPTPSVEKAAARGFITIKSVTPRFAGLFYFKCEDSTEVSGVFDIDPL